MAKHMPLIKFTIIVGSQQLARLSAEASVMYLARILVIG